jgi:O-antigen/teichoic acid export membrane protein
LSLLNRPVVLLALGLGLSAAAGSGFLAVVNHSMAPALVAPLPGLYFLFSAIGTGMFAGFEQEMVRAVSRALALGQSESRVIRHQVRNAAWVGIGTVAVVCAAGPYVTHHWMYGHWVVFAELLLGLAGIWASFLVRGVLSGRQQFRSYAITMVVEGLARLLPSIGLALSGYGSTWAYGLIFALGPMIAALSGLLVARAPIPARAPDAPPVTDEPESANQAAVRLARLTGGILAGQVLMYSVPLVVSGRLTTAPALAIAVSSAVGLTRLALLVLFPLQAPLLPKLTAAAAQGRMADVRRATVTLTAVCTAAGLAGVAVSGVFGPWILHTIMGTKAYLSPGFLMQLSAGTLFLLLANALQSTLIALNRQQTVLMGWCLGVVAMAAVFAIPLDALTTAGVASIAGPVVTTAIMTADVLRRTKTPASPDTTDTSTPASEPAMGLEPGAEVESQPEGTATPEPERAAHRP